MSRSSARFHDSHTLYDITKRNTRVLTVSVPPETADDFERIAEAEGRNRSELFREMLRVYRTYEETRTFESLSALRRGPGGPSRDPHGGGRRASHPGSPGLRAVFDTNVLIWAFVFLGGAEVSGFRRAIRTSQRRTDHRGHGRPRSPYSLSATRM
jgi:ribbon-helix-helix CopG family protein